MILKMSSEPIGVIRDDATKEWPAYVKGMARCPCDRAWPGGRARRRTPAVHANDAEAGRQAAAGSEWRAPFVVHEYYPDSCRQANHDAGAQRRFVWPGKSYD
jgi:hypothetical protein